MSPRRGSPPRAALAEPRGGGRRPALVGGVGSGHPPSATARPRLAPQAPAASDPSRSSPDGRHATPAGYRAIADDVLDQPLEARIAAVR